MPRPVHRPTLEQPSTAPRAAVPSPALLFFDANTHTAPHTRALPTLSTARHRSTTKAFKSTHGQLLYHPHGERVAHCLLSVR